MKVKFIYFKENGKYYSEGNEDIKGEGFYDVVRIIHDMLRDGKRPGLVDGSNEFHTLAIVDTSHGELPHLFPRR